MAYLDENGEIVNGTGDSTQDARMRAPMTGGPSTYKLKPGDVGYDFTADPNSPMFGWVGPQTTQSQTPVLFNSPINGAVYQTPTKDNGFSGYEGPRPSNPDGTTMGRNGTNPQDKTTSSSRGDVQTDHGIISGADADRIDQMLASAQSTDDKSYWYGIAAQNGGVDNTGVDWLTDRINRGDGALGVRNGTVQKFQDNGGSVDPLNPGQFSYQPFNDQFVNPNFVAPTGITEQNDPGYQERLRLGAQTLQASAAAKGTLLTGQTAKDLEDYAQNFASGEFGQVYNRALGEYNANSANNWQQYSQKYQQYLNGYQQALGQFNTNLGAGQQAFGDNLALSNQNFGQNQQNWQNQFNTTQLGLGAAENFANLGLQYSNQQGGYLTGNGNANAAGTVGGANATQYGLGALANYAQYLTPYLSNNGGGGGGGGNFGGYYGSTPPGGSTFYSPQHGGNNGQFWGY